MDWRKAVPALARAAGRNGEALASADGDREEAASLLWKQSRHDTLLREDLVKAACALFALAPVATDPPSGWKRRPGPLSRLDRDPEVGAFVRERLGTVPVAEIVRQLPARSGAAIERAANGGALPHVVMPGLVPGIHVRPPGSSRRVVRSHAPWGRCMDASRGLRRHRRATRPLRRRPATPRLDFGARRCNIPSIHHILGVVRGRAQHVVALRQP